MRRAAILVCVGVLIVTVLIPVAVAVPAVAIDRAIVEPFQSSLSVCERTSLPSPLLAILTPRHLARAALPSFAH